MTTGFEPQCRRAKARIRRFALALACLLFFLHTVGELFHWQAHVPHPTTAAVVTVAGTVGQTNFVAAVPVPLSDDCPLCALHAVCGVLSALIIAFVLIASGMRQSVSFLRAAVSLEPGRRGPPRAPPAFA